MYFSIIIAACFLVAAALYLIVEYILHSFSGFPLIKIPHVHPTATFSSRWISTKRKTRTELRSIFEAHQRKGPIVLLGPNEVSVASLEGLRQVYTSGAFDKDPWYIDMFMNYSTPNLVSMLDRASHSKQKRMISNIYSKSFLFNSIDLEKITREILDRRLVPLLGDLAQRNAEVDVFELNKAIGYDLTHAYLFGLSTSRNFILDLPTRRKFLSKWLICVRKLPGCEEAKESLETNILTACHSAYILDEQIKKNPDMLSEPSVTRPVVFSQLYLRLMRETDGKDAGTELMPIVASEMFDHLLAGQETTAITMTYLMYELSLRPKLQASLRKEIFKLQTNQGSAYPSYAAEIDALPLLNPIVQETLRLYPATPGPQPRIVPTEGTIVGGYFIPKGVKIHASAYTLHRNEEVFPEAKNFEPKRWLSSHDGKGTDTMRRWFWSFGSGGRMCIGSNFALHVLKATTVAIYSNFTTTIVDDEGIEPQDGWLGSPVAERLILMFHPIQPEGVVLSGASPSVTA